MFDAHTLRTMKYSLYACNLCEVQVSNWSGKPYLRFNKELISSRVKPLSIATHLCKTVPKTKVNKLKDNIIILY